MDNGAIEEQIRKILSAPDVDLATISSKKVRGQLAEQFGSSVIKQNKEAIDALVIELYNNIVNATGVAEQDVKREEEEQKPTKQESPSANGHTPLQAVPTNASRPNKAVVKAEPPASDASSVEEDEEDASASDYDMKEDAKPSTSSFSKPKPKASPQKRRLKEEDAIPPTSSPGVPLAMTTAQTDEEFARKLQEEMNATSRGRSTRGGGFQKKGSKKGSSSKKGAAAASSKKKYRSKDYIDDSDAGEGHDKGEGSESEDDDGSDASVAEKKPKKKRAAGSGGGGYMKELALSEPLQKVCGAQTMARPSIVKHLWAYIREQNLQNPAKKSEIINDELFIDIFGVKSMTMFSMNKYLKKAVKPIDG